MERDTEKSSNLAIAIIFVAVFVAVMLLAVYIVVDSMSSAQKSLNGAVTTTGTAVNETHLANGTIGYFDLTYKGYQGYTVTCSSPQITNASDAVVISSGNYSLSACRITLTSPGIFNNTNWNVTYAYSYDSTNSTGIDLGYTQIKTNVFGLVDNFFALAPTIGTILAVVILIAAIVILVLYVKRMKEQEGSESSYTG